MTDISQTSGFDLSKKDKEAADPKWKMKDRKIFALHITKAAVFILFAIWVIACWIFGSIAKQSERSHKLPILLLDLDGGNIGTVVTGAAHSISGQKGYASFVTPKDITGATAKTAYDDVWRGDYWAALVINPNASTNLATAIAKGDTSYNASSALTFIWNEVRWALVSEMYISPTVSTTVAIAQKLYAKNIASKVIASTQLTQNQTLVLLNPFAQTTHNIYSFSVGIKPFINTVGFVFPGLVQFFFAMGYMGAAGATHLTTNLSTSKNYMIRFVLSRIWGFVMAISWAGWFFIFSEGQSGLYDHSFIFLTLNMWIYNLISYEYHDACVAFIPLQLMPISIISWIIMNISAAAFPVQLKPDFFRFDYAVPAYNCFELFITIMSKGSTSRVGRDVGVLFAWLIVTGVIGVFTNQRRCRQAREMEAAMQARRQMTESGDEELTRVRTENEEVAHGLGMENTLLGMMK